MGRPSKLTPETKEEGWLFTIGEMLAMYAKGERNGEAK